MTHTPPSLFERAIDQRVRMIKRMVYSLIVMNILLWGFIVYREVNDAPTIEVVE